MAKKKETAEQKLLKMIEATSGVGVAVKQKPVPRKYNALTIIKTVNKVFYVSIVVCGLLFINEVRSGIALMGKDVQVDVKSKKTAVKTDMANLIPDQPKVSFYLAGVLRRNIFEAYDASGVESAEGLGDQNQLLAQRIANLKLVGISWLDTVDSAKVIIEDTNKKETYFLQKGEKIGDITVKTIYADSALLSYQNEEITIRYDKSQM